jgi:antitoxin ParD1/3/4
VGKEQLLEGQAMTIEINRPEIEALIRQRLRSGAFESAEDVLFDALEIQSEREVWLQENKDAINAKIERGLAQLDRGEGIPDNQLRTRLADDKAAWLKDRSDL